MSAPLGERRRGPLARQRGITLIEILIGLVVALVITLVAAGSAKMFGAAQRQGIGTGTATTGSATALAAIKNDLTTAGLGFFGDSAFKCHRMQLSRNSTTLYDSGTFSPVRVTRDDTTGNDQIDVFYASSIDSGAGVLIHGSSDGSSATLMSYLPVSVGDAVLMMPKTAGSTAAPCLVRSVTGVTASTETTRQSVTFANTGTYNQVSFTAPPSFAEQDRVVRLGELRWSRYRVNGTDLLLERPLEGTSAILQRNVLALRAEYGVNDGTSGTLTGWQSAASTNTPWNAVGGSTVDRVSALRVGIVTRSVQREREDPSTGLCIASTGPGTLLGTAVTADVTDPNCYRYRSTVFIAPLRNLAW